MEKSNLTSPLPNLDHFRFVSPDAIPAELKKEDQWIYWKAEDRNGKQTKVPYSPLTGKKASVANPSHWSSFESAYQCWDTSQGDGVGFVFTPYDHFVGVDLDECRDPETGEVADWALEVIAALNTYTEISQSGTGIHCIGVGELPPGRNRKGQIEMYDRNRYFTMTGHSFQESPLAIRDLADTLEEFHSRIFESAPNKSTSSCGPQPSQGIELDDQTLLEMALKARNGGKFRMLWEGKWSEAGYSSQSEADAALVAMLAFWTGREPDQMDRLFRESCLYRDKWDELRGEQTYGELTIKNAIDRCSEVYEPKENRASSVQSAAPQERKWVRMPGENHELLDCVREILDPVRRVLPWYQCDGVVTTPRAGKLEEVTPAEATSEIEKAVCFCVEKEKIQTPKPITKNLAGLILSAPEFWGGLPRIKSIETVPTPFIKNKDLVWPQPGYDHDLQTYTFFQSSIPQPMAVPDAKVLLDQILADFCWADDSTKGSREANQTNAIAAMLTLVARNLYDGLTPGFMICGNQPGIGKGFVVKVICLPILGEEPPAYPWNTEENENRKRLLSIAREGRLTYWIDDIDGYIKSPSLNMALTARFIEDRILGRSGTGCYPWRAITLLTGNNYKIAPDLARRIIPIHLHFPKEDIDHREYSQPELLPWMKAHRDEILSALYGLVQNWFTAGMPKCSHRMASYDEWAGTVGGILETAGYQGFLEARKSIASQSDLETSDMRLLFQQWFSQHGDKAIGTPDILDMLKFNELFPYVLDGSDSSATSRLGKLLERWTDRELDDFVLTRVGTRRPARYSLTKVKATDDDSHPQTGTEDWWMNNPIPFPADRCGNPATIGGEEPQQGVRVDGFVRFS